MKDKSQEIIHPDWIEFRDILSEPFGWTHLSGSPGQGKTSFVRWLKGQLGNYRSFFILDLAKPTDADQQIGISFQVCLTETLAAEGFPSPLSDKLLQERDRTTESQVKTGWTVLEEVARNRAKMSGKRPIIVLDGLDWLLWNSLARRALMNQLKAWTAHSEFDVLTTSVLSHKSLKTILEVTGLADAKELRLRPLTKDDVQFLNNLSIAKACEHSDLESLLKLTGGRLRPVYEVLSIVPPSECLGDFLFEISDLIKNEAPKVRDAQIAPIIEGKPPHSGAEYANRLAKMAKNLSIRLKNSPTKGIDKSEIEKWNLLADDFGWLISGQPQAELPRLLKVAAKSIDLIEFAKRLEFHSKTLAKKERRVESDADLLMVRLKRIVEKNFCKGAIGISRNANLISDLSRCIQRGRHYSFSLKADDIASNQFYVLKVFPNPSTEGADLLDLEILMLRHLSDERHPALPRLQGGGRLDSNQEAPDLRFSYLLTVVDGAPLREPPKMEPEELIDRLEAVQLLAGALTRLHESGIFHRRVILSNILKKSADPNPVSHEIVMQFVLTGFEFAHYVNPIYSDTNPMHQIKEMQDAMTSPYDILCCPPEFMSDATTAPGVPIPDPIAKSDVFGMAMIASMLLHGAPDQKYVESVRDAPDNEKREVFNTFLESYTQSVGEDEDLPEDLRKYLVSALSPELDKRPVASVFSSNLEYVLKDIKKIKWPHNDGNTNDRMLVVYNKALSASELQIRGIIPKSGDPDDAKVYAEEFVHDFFRKAHSIRFDKDGYARFVKHRRVEAKKAKIVIIGQTHVAYCNLFIKDIRSSNKEELNWALSLRCIVSRRQFGGVQKETVTIPFPKDMIEVLEENSYEFDKLKADGTPLGWNPWNKHIEAAKNQSENEGPRKAAFLAWDFAIKVQEKLATLRFPVLVSDENNGDKVAIILDATEFRRMLKDDEYVDLFYKNSFAATPEEFFSQFISNWLEVNAVSGGQLYFLPTFDPTKERPKRVFLGDDVIVGYGRLIANDHMRLNGCGQLLFRHAYSPVSEIGAKFRVIQDVLAGSPLFEQLDRPQPRMLVERELQGSFKDRLTKGRSAQIVERMVNSEPIFALQGPPGTGKSTALAEYVNAVLDHSPLTRMLLTSQSHVAVDVLLDKITELVWRQDDENPPVIARIEPSINRERLSRNALSHSLDQVVKDRFRRIKSQARTETHVATDPKLQAAWGKIQDLPFEEVDKHIRNGVSLLFCTTSASRHQMADRRSSETYGYKFDVAVVEEAGRADASDLLLPLVQAPRQIVIGDHKQLPAFSEQQLSALLKKAKQIYETDWERSGASEHSFADIANNFTEVKAWLSPFQRMFDLREKAEEEVKRVANDTGDGTISASAAFSDRVIDTLETQFRSHPDIGNMISQTFYEGKVGSPGDRGEWPPRLLFDRLKLETRPLTWIDTSDMHEGEFIERIESAGKTQNLGEIKIVGALVNKFKFNLDLQQTEKRLRSQVMFMSPYKAQVDLIKEELQKNGRKLLLGKLADNQANERTETTFTRRIASIISTVDASQGSEADLVVISFARSKKFYDNEPMEGSAAPNDWEMAIRRNFGFISDPRRINVMMSRARAQVVVIGNLQHFETLSRWVQNWANSCLRPDLDYEYRDRSIEITKLNGFWGKLIKEFETKGAIIPAEEILKI